VQTVAQAEELESSDRVRQLYQTYYRVGGFKSGGLRRLKRLTDAPRSSGQQAIEGPMGYIEYR